MDNKNAEGDAFIGIDIDVEPPDGAAGISSTNNNKRPSSSSTFAKNKNGNVTTTATSRKRPRPPPSSSTTATTTTTARKRPKKPKPPPNPPKSLVSLLQKDDSVRSYFQSLQENLEYDVDKWKHEAARWKTKLANTNSTNTTSYFQPKKKNGSNNNGATLSVARSGKATTTTTMINKAKRPKSKRVTAAKKKKMTSEKSSSSSSSLLSLSCNKLEQKTDKEIEGGGSITIPITDEALFGDMSDDDDDDDDDDSVSSSVQENAPHDYDNDAKTSSMLIIEGSSRNQDSKEMNTSIQVDVRRSSHILEHLKEAKKCLDMLGVSLVEVEVNTTVTLQQQTINELSEGGTATFSDAPGNISTRATTTSFVRANNEVEGNKKSSNAMMEEDANDPQQHTTDGRTPSTVIERILHRQSDEKVAAEMMASLKTLIKCSSFVGSTTTVANDDDRSEDEDVDEDDLLAAVVGDGGGGANNQQLGNEELVHRCRLRRRYHPFCRDGHLHTPTTYYSSRTTCPDNKNGKSYEETAAMPKHPASMGLKHVITILSIMDTYCGDDLDDDEWNAIFEYPREKNCQTTLGGEDHYDVEDEEMVILQIGMKNRCRLTQRLLSSLNVEITRTWALSDRASNLATSSIHFHPADVLAMDDPENENIHNQMYGAKSYNRLVTLEERVGHARIASLLHRSRGGVQRAAEMVVGFIISSAPSLGAEHYPKVPPVLSMCVLEALLSPENYVPSNVGDAATNIEEGNEPADASQGWFRGYMQRMFSSDAVSSSRTEITLLMRALAYPVHVAASIWRERYVCADDRVRDIAAVELAAYGRIQRLHDGAWWLANPTFDVMDIEHITKLGTEILSSATTSGKFDSNKMRAVAGISCTVSLLTLGDVDQVIQLCEEISASMKNNFKDIVSHRHFLLPACCSAYSSIMCRRWDSMKLGSTSSRHTSAAFTVEDTFSPVLDAVTQHAKLEDDWQTIDIIVQCCVLLGDGRSLQRLASRVVPNITQSVMTQKNNRSMAMNQLMSRTMTSLIDAGEIPTVRVINLERRPDRALDFVGCTVHKEQLIVVKGPAKLRRKALVSARNNSKMPSFVGPKNDDEECPGNFAFDGQCSRDELEKQLQQRLDGKGTLSDFVKPKWRPSELKAFDRDARGDFELVNTSITEKACALSHIASWMGVESNLSDIVSSRTEYGQEWYQMKLARMFKISGFARGAPLLHENEDMDPVPVCVILEDDAVLNDRFAERLASLLEELPRDFHFLSLGYSRPKAAPMVEYSTHLGIPSCLWYLTGYVLSLDGARHLIKSLPVTGPVDSWIGLKMCSNWDNKFGDLIGVGKYTKAKTKLPPRKDLAKIMKFRAFAALVPLCSQKVGGAPSAPAVTRGGWRDRDTDITYSG